MRWPLSRRKAAKHAQPRDAVIVAVTQPLTRQTAQDLARAVDRVDREAPVVIDLTAIPGFDSDGADALLALQAARGADRVSIVGLRQATARLVGPDDPAPVAIATPGSGWALRRLRNLVVVQPLDTTAPTPSGLSDAVAAASTDTTAAIIVVDLRGLLLLPADVVETIAFASSAAALRGQELLVVNVAVEVAETLRDAGLSATTYVAPEPPLDPFTG
jgi:anti-anti-sigma regulatory factor